MSRTRNVLVTGAAGFIGSHFVEYFLSVDKNVRIWSYDKLTYAGTLDNLEPVQNNPRHTFVHGDICDPQKIASLLRLHQIDTIVHFAAESHVDNSIESPAIFFETNLLGTLNLLQQAKEYWLDEMHWSEENCLFHHVSTDEVYGSLTVDEAAFTETTPYAPNSPYAASKASSNHVVRAYNKTFGLPVTISNCSNNYGPRQHSEKLIPTTIRCCLQQKPIPVYGNGQNQRDWLYVTDHCMAIHAILQQGGVGEVYNIGGGYDVDNLTLIKAICRVMDKRFPAHAPHENLIHFVTDRKGHDFRYAIDNTKINRDLSWSPETEPDIGLEKTVASYMVEREIEKEIEKEIK